MCEVSVVMPVFNAEKYLKESIESILNQTYKNFEFIIVNDGSTDESLKIINKYAKLDERIVVISRKNKGIVDSLNEAIAKAKGEYIARMDSDDIAMVDRLQKQVGFFCKNSEIDILGSFIEPFGEKDNEEAINSCRLWFNRKIESDIEKSFFEGSRIAHPSVMFKSNFIKSIGGYNGEYKCVEDYELWLRAIKNGFKIFNMDEILLKYRVHEDSKSSIDLKYNDAIKERIIAKLRHIDYIMKDKNINYIIWGAGNGGFKVKAIIDQMYPNSKLSAYIDKFKSGEVDGVKVLKPDDIKYEQFDYIFIATAPGMEEADEYLSSLEYRFKEDYCYIL